MKRNSILSIKELNTENKREYINSIWYAIVSISITMLDILLDEEINYEDIGKQKFIDKLN